MVKDPVCGMNVDPQSAAGNNWAKMEGSVVGVGVTEEESDVGMDMGVGGRVDVTKACAVG